MNGFFPSRQHQAKPPGQYPLPPIQQTTHQPPYGHFGTFSAGPNYAQRPSSSQSAQSAHVPSPIRNRPSMSPTQGNHDVGPLAGFPLPAPQNGSIPFTPSGGHARPPTASHNVTPTMHGGYSSFSAATPSGNHNFNHSSPPQSSHGMHMSGISPVKHSPRPMTAGSTTGASVLPPIQALEPSPKLMGRSSPDAPVPSPMKCMTPEQERKSRENNPSF